MYWCGIDIAKRKHMIALMDDQGQLLKTPFEVANERAGFERLRQELTNLAEPVTIGLEATGHYWLALYENLTQQYPVVVFNALQIHAYRKSGVRKVKNDRSDASWIADFLRIGHHPPRNSTTTQLMQLRELSRFRYHLTDQISDCKRKVLCVLDRVFPEYETAFSNVFLAASRRILNEATTAHEIAEFDLTELTALLRTASRGRFREEQARSLQALARQSVGVSFLADAARVEVRCLLAQIELLESQRQQVDEALAELMAQIPQYLTTITGIGPTTGAAILAEIGDIQRFDSLEKLVGYAGIDTAVHQTGQFEAHHMHMSKRGSPYLRHALWQAASMAIRYDAELKAYYDRKRAEGKHHGTVLGAICHKLLARIYVVLKQHRPFVPH